MSVIDAIVGDYKARAKQSIDVPEWGTDGVPLTIFWNLLTIEQRQKLFANPGRTDVDVLIMMARTASDEPMFGKEDKPKLVVSADASVITRVALLMLGTGKLTDAAIDDALKN
jgi:hypothetical protein